MIWILLMLWGDAPAPAKFRDEAAYEGRSAVAYRAVDWNAKPALPVDPADGLPKGTQFGASIVGAEGKAKLMLAWDAATSTLMIDRDGNGRYLARDRFPLAVKPVEIPVNIDGRQRTLLARLRGGEPVLAIRGFVEGTVEIEGNSRKYLLMDGDGDGCFHHAGSDRIGIDLDGDGRIDPLTELFTVGTAVEIAGVKYFLKPDPTGEKIEVRRRPEAKGRIEFSLARSVKAKPTGMKIGLVSEWGEWVQLDDIEKAETLPVGQYRVQSLEFSLPATKYETWSYAFYNPGSKLAIVVTADRKTSYELLPDLKLRFDLDAKNQAGSQQIAPWVAASNGLTMRSCERQTPGGADRGVNAEILLNGEGSSLVDKATSSFF